MRRHSRAHPEENLNTDEIDPTGAPSEVLNEDDLAFVLPQPTPEDVADFVKFFYARRGRILPEEEARDTLARLMSIVYYTAVIDLECSPTGSTHANHEKIRR